MINLKLQDFLKIFAETFKKKFLLFFLGFFISLYFMYLLYEKTSIELIIETLRNISLSGIIFGAIFIVIAHLIRAYRWHYILSDHKESTIKYSQALIYLKGNALNTFMPLRLGDIYRLFVTFKILSKRESLVIFMSEKFIDLIITIQMFILGFIIIFGFNEKFLNYFFMVLIMLSFFAFMFLTKSTINYFFSKRLFYKKYFSKYIFLKNIKILKNLKLILSLSYFSWFLEVLAFQQIISSFGLLIDFFSSLILSSGGALSTIIPSLPSNVGTFHFVITEITKNLGATPDSGISYSIIIHFVFIITIQVLGLLSLLTVILFNLREKIIGNSK